MPEESNRHLRQAGPDNGWGSGAANQRTADRIERILGVIPEQVRHGKGNGEVAVRFNAVDLDLMLDRIEASR